MISQGREELAVGRFTLLGADGEPKEFLDGIQIAPIPGQLNSVPDSSFHPAGVGIECLGNSRVQLLGDRSQDVLVAQGNEDCFPYVLIAQYVSRNTKSAHQLGSFLAQEVFINSVISRFLNLIVILMDFHNCYSFSLFLGGDVFFPGSSCSGNSTDVFAEFTEAVLQAHNVEATIILK